MQRISLEMGDQIPSSLLNSLRRSLGHISIMEAHKSNRINTPRLQQGPNRITHRSLPSPLRPQRPSGSRSCSSSNKGKGLACPYRQRYPTCATRVTSCLHAFPTTARLKGHLLRSHMELYECLRCHTAFKTQASYEEHLRSPTQCTESQQSAVYTFGRDVQNQLKKKSRRGMPEVEKWAEVYQAIFPGEQEVPSPYHDEAPFEEFRAYARENSRQLLLKKLNSARPQGYHVSQFSGAMIEELADILCQCNDNMVQLFQQRQQIEASLDETALAAIADHSTNVFSINTLSMTNEGYNVRTQHGNSLEHLNTGPALPATIESTSSSTGTLVNMNNDQVDVAVNESAWMDFPASLQQPSSTSDWQPEWGHTSLPAAWNFTQQICAPSIQTQLPTNSSLANGSDWMQQAWFTTTDQRGFAEDMFCGPLL